MSAPVTSPSLGQQLIPGDSDALTATAERWSDLARRCASAGWSLSRVDSSDWVGAAGEAFRSRLGSHPAQWHDAMDAFETASRALRGFAVILGDAQAQAARALELYREGERLSARARMTLGPAAAIQDPGAPLRTQAVGQAVTAEREVAAAAADVERVLTDAALGAPDAVRVTAPVRVGAPPGGLCVDGPDGTCVSDHTVPITAGWDEQGHVVSGASYPVPAGTMFPTFGVTDRQTVSEPVAPGQNPQIVWQDGEVDAAYIRTHDIGWQIGAPVALAFTFGKQFVDDIENVVEHPTVGSVAMAAAGFTPFGRAAELARAAETVKAARDIEKAENRLDEALTVESAGMNADHVSRGVANERRAAIDLGAAEQSGGHTLERHVGISDEALVARNVTYASTFADSTAAERVTAENISLNAHAIDEWLAGTSPRLVLHGPMDPTSGRVYERATRTFIPPGGVKTVLIRSANGYTLLTSYPVR